MTRFTEKGTGIINCGGTIASLGKEEYKKRYSEQVVKSHIKLGQLEDIEDELGIDLITLFKALKQGAWFIDPRNKNKFFAMCSLCSKIDGKFECAQEELRFNGFIILDQLFGLGYDLKNYGKTWALTKEELENE